MERVILSGRGPARVCSLLRGTHDGSVRLVTSAGTYLKLGDRIILLCPERWGIVPIGVSLRNYEALLGLNPEPGQPVSIREGTICFPAGSAQLRLTAAERSKKGGQVREAALYRLAKILADENRKAGLAPLAALLQPEKKPWQPPNPYCASALPAIRTLLEGVAAGDRRRIDRGLDALLGLGPGLTPSGDDVLCGILYVLLRSDASERAGVRMLAQAAAAEAPAKTNAVSAAYLTAIAGGEDYERMQGVWLELTGEDVSRAGQLLEVGSCSGGDMLFGMLAAGRLLPDLGQDGTDSGYQGKR